MSDTESRHILITGASSALGMEIVRSLADNHQIILASCHSRCAGLMDMAAAPGARLEAIQADLSSPEGLEQFLIEVESHTTAPHAIVLLPAPKLQLKRFKDLAWADFEAQLNLQLRSAVGVLNRFLPRMAKLGRGRVVLALSSVTLGMPPKAMAHYVATKYALLGLSMALAAEYADRGITVNAVSPGMMDTALLEELPEKLLEMTAMQNPMRRLATPADVAPLVAYLLSDAAGYLTGLNIPVTGGSVA